MKIRRIFLLTAILLAGLNSCGNGGGRHSSDSGSPSGTGAVASAGEGNAEDKDSLAVTPEIRFISRGSILPSDGDMNLLFGSTSYAKARVRVKKIYSDNILQFLQFDSYESRYNLYKVADTVADTTIVLGAPDSETIRAYRTYGLSLGELIKPERGAIYHIEIRGLDALAEETFPESDSWFGNYETYPERSVDLLASDLAMVVRHGDRGYEATVLDILSGRPVGGARVRLFSFAQQELAKGLTDREGRVSFPAVEEAGFAVAMSGRNYAYLRLSNENSLSTSSFDVSGDEGSRGLKAYIFGERGVWRPGDTLHISTIFMCDGTELPEGHPVTAELRNPDGQLTESRSARIDRTHICHFPFTTAADAPTGRWSVKVDVGSHSFSKTLRVETIKPNNLDISLKFKDSYITPKEDCTGEIGVEWLYGAVGSNLKVNGSMELSVVGVPFKGYESYSFKDAGRSFSSQTLNYGDMTTDDEGRCSINTGVSLNRAATPGMLNAEFTLRAFEPSGDFSTSYSSVRMSPFDRYVGIRTAMDKDEWGNEYLRSGKPHDIEVVTLDPSGKGVDAPSLQAEVWHVDWSWWWDASHYTASYNSGKIGEKVYSTSLSTSGGKGRFSYDWPEDVPSGPYMIRVSDPNGGHSATLLCEVYRDRSASDASEGSVKLNMLLDKSSYKVGETARITIPSSAGSIALVSIEKGGRILSGKRVDCHPGSTQISIPITAEMTPNVYADISLIQPHGNSSNDAPIRLYGIANINVEDALSRLHPQIEMEGDIRPESEVGFSVRERNGRAMSYVVAIVDEGLLNLTGFKTPDAWDSFYAKQSLRVRSWDMYDKVIGAYGGQIEKLFAIGGSDEASRRISPQGASRFTPVVSYLGPFELKQGRTGRHKIYVPQYLGRLRAMVIATDGRAQGSTEKEVTVTKPLMVLATLPRTLSIGESLSVPVSVIAVKDGIGKVKLSAEASGGLSTTGPAEAEVQSLKAGQQIVRFDVKVGDRPGTAKFAVTARTASEKSRSEIEIDILNPNPEEARVSSFTLAPGERKEVDAELFGVDGSNSLDVEFSSIPQISLGRRLEYLTGYPYGCVEQTVSAAFPQLYLDLLQDCGETVLKRSAFNVSAAISRLSGFRRPDGSLSYWPGSDGSSSFGSVYALHFLQEASAKGYAVPADLKASLVKYISSSVVSDRKENAFTRAYGLYALAIAGKPQRGAMNLLREDAGKLQNSAVWMLAAAYAADGKKQVAQGLVSGLPYLDDPKKEYAAFGSEERNMAVALKTALLLGDRDAAMELAIKTASRLNEGDRYMSTQTTAWSLCAMSAYAGKAEAQGIQANVRAEGRDFSVSTSKCIASRTVSSGADGGRVALVLENRGRNTIHAAVSASGIPAAGEERAKASGLKMTVRYIDENGKEISADALRSGQSFKSAVTVTNTGSASVSNLALSQKFPSGWEIRNDRIYRSDFSYPAGIDYQDFRDDRVYSFFSLEAGRSVTVTTTLTAAYAGKFYLPAVSCEAMYDNTVSALVPGRRVEVR